jgi:hypothetical protein
LNPEQIKTTYSTNDPDIIDSSASITFVDVSLLFSLLNRNRSLLRRLAAIENGRKCIQQFDNNPLANTTQMINSTLSRFKPSICIDYCVLNPNEDNEILVNEPEKVLDAISLLSSSLFHHDGTPLNIPDDWKERF